jgi:hypothetical protein
MLASALRSYVRRWGVDPGRVVVFGNNDSALAAARALTAEGVRVLAYVDPRPIAPVRGVSRLLRRRSTGTTGPAGPARRCDSATGAASARSRPNPGALGRLEPDLHLACHTGARPDWDAAIAAFVPRPGMVPGMRRRARRRGDSRPPPAWPTGRGGAGGAIGSGPEARPRCPCRRPRTAPMTSPPLAVEAPGRAWLDFANDVTTKDVTLAAQEGFASVEHMKRYTTQGMAPDQGKSSNVAALAVLAEATGRIPATGTTTFRPPFVPVSIAALGAGARDGLCARTADDLGPGFASMGAPMIEAGLWYRPSYFPRAGEATWREACDREVPWCARRWASAMSRRSARSTFRDPMRALSRFRLHQRDVDAEARARALRADAARGRACHGRRHLRAAGEDIS